MNDHIYTYHALKWVVRKRFFWSKAKEVLEVVATTQNSNWLWAEHCLRHVCYDQLVKIEVLHKKTIK